MDRDKMPFLPHGGYPKLRSYAVAEAVYDATVVFCRRFLAHDRRTTDQMVQAARSGVRNISEGSGAAATSSKSEMNSPSGLSAEAADRKPGSPVHAAGRLHRTHVPPAAAAPRVEWTL